MMAWDDFDEPQSSSHHHHQPDAATDHQDAYLNFDFFSLVSTPKDYYKLLEVDYDASDDAIRSNYIRLALKWHPDKHKDQDNATSRFQDINEAYQVLSDPERRREYDATGMSHVYDYNIIEYLNRYKGLILTCNGLGIKQSIW
ncbi:Chaperone protein DnaJ [Linum perenne]